MPEAAPEDAVVLRGISMRFGTTLVLDGIDLTVERGRFVTLIGPSGCGKSTLLRIAAGLVNPDQGTVELFGLAPQSARRAKQIGLVPQSPALLPWRRVIDNVALPGQVNRGAGAVALDPVEMLARVGLSSVSGLRPHQLSGGMAQRVAIARALVSRPSLLVMDEPFSALDELTREVLRQVLLDVWEADRTTVLFVTHSVTEAVQLSDEVVVLTSAPGRVVDRIQVPLGHPRLAGIELSDPFRAVEKKVREALRVGWQPHGS